MNCPKCDSDNILISMVAIVDRKTGEASSPAKCLDCGHVFRDRDEQAKPSSTIQRD